MSEGGLHHALWQVLGFGLLPAWLAAGAADWWCHRRSCIERTSGPRESMFHLLLFLEIAVPAIMALWLEINAALLVVMAAGILAHLVTSWWDTTYAQPRRRITAFEHSVHSWLELLPLFALLLICLLHWPQVTAPEWQFVAREQPTSAIWRTVVLTGFAAALAFILEESLRSTRQRP
jgi:hypothetical protein